MKFLGKVFDEAPGPIVTATVYGKPETWTTDSAIVVDSKRSYVRIKTGNGVGWKDDRSFCFTAIGTYEVRISSLAGTVALDLPN